MQRDARHREEPSGSARASARARGRRHDPPRRASAVFACRALDRLVALPLPNGVGYLATLVLFAGAIGYGVVQGGHITATRNAIVDTLDAGADALGFGVQTVAITGRRTLSEATVRQAAGIGPGASVPFLDVAAARNGLLDLPAIAEASVRKFFPDRIEIDIVEREPFALWQRGGKLSIIAADGTVIAGADAAQPPALPLVVGIGADRKARDIIALLEAHPDIRLQTRAAVFVAERRWNLKLKNGIDIRLPERDAAAALASLSRLDRERRLLSRDITAVDLRLSDRVTVRLSDEAGKAREALRLRTLPRKKGTDT